MPSYDYECTKCGHSFELEQKISAPPRERCPECRGKVVRVISGGGGVILKGKGFYATDYRSESYKKGAKAEGAGPESGTGSGSGTGSESGTGGKKDRD
jgi:putative FmdB family regulatory protein